MFNFSKSQSFRPPQFALHSRLIASVALVASTCFCSIVLAQWRVTGVDVPQLVAFDTAMKTIMTQQGATSAQLAITWQGRLVLGHGYSLNPTPQDIVTEPDSLFRIASVSKPITATLVQRLVQDGKLTLNQKLGEFVDLTPSPGRTADPRMARITVRHLLEHLGGFDIAVLGFDPIGNDAAIASSLGVALPVSKANIIKFMNGISLSHEPGTTFAYSNYGYLLLGRIIEKVTGLTYEKYATSVFNPIGISTMRQARSLIQNRAPNEVFYRSKYANPSVMDNSGAILPLAYGGGNNMENFDALGGWVMSAIDMVRWLSNLDAPSSPNAILNQTSIDRMFAPPENYPLPYVTGNAYYGGGWFVRNYGGSSNGSYNTWHDGALGGTTSYVVRLRSGLTYAAVFNIRNETASGDFHGDIDSAMGNVINQINQWPKSDLFPTTVVEYYNRDLDAYFVTGRANEQAAIDGVASFQRTGGTFAATSAANETVGLTPICRYYISVANPYTSSHFYGPRDTDCAFIANAKPAGFSYDGLDFAVTLPVSGACPATAPFAIYRSFRAGAGGKTSNHRFSTSLARYNEMTAKGWSPEGVVFCAASGTAATQ